MLVALERLPLHVEWQGPAPLELGIRDVGHTDTRGESGCRLSWIRVAICVSLR